MCLSYGADPRSPLTVDDTNMTEAERGMILLIHDQREADMCNRS